MSGFSGYRVTAWSTADGAGRGRNAVAAIVDDASDIGWSTYANDGGECFFTLPYNHPQIAQMVPLQRHIEISRRSTTGTYVPLWVGLLDDYSATRDEVVFYGRDYISLLDTSITGSNTSYTNAAISTIVSAEVSNAVNQNSDSANSRLGFITTGTIEATSKTTTVLTSYQSRLQFMQGLLEILAAGGTTRPLLSFTRSAPITISFQSNAGSDKENIRLEWGGLVRDFNYEPGYGQIITNQLAIGQKREGASILFADQTYASITDWGRIQDATVFIDVVDQQALDDLTLDLARQRGVLSRIAGITIQVNGLIPWDGYDLMDSLRVMVSRGITSVNALYTLFGAEWTVSKNGAESLFLDLRLKKT